MLKKPRVVMSIKGANVAALVAWILKNKMAQTTNRRSQGTTVHAVITSPEVQLRYVSWQTLLITYFVTTFCRQIRLSLSGKTAFSAEYNASNYIRCTECMKICPLMRLNVERINATILNWIPWETISLVKQWVSFVVIVFYCFLSQ